MQGEQTLIVSQSHCELTTHRNLSSYLHQLMLQILKPFILMLLTAICVKMRGRSKILIQYLDFGRQTPLGWAGTDLRRYVIKTFGTWVEQMDTKQVYTTAKSVNWSCASLQLSGHLRWELSGVQHWLHGPSTVAARACSNTLSIFSAAASFSLFSFCWNFRALHYHDDTDTCTVGDADRALDVLLR